ncbi:DUF1566 domain-containing protein [Leptospira kmetyi]|uniref:DUF1566 domain-containing protein n=1 Tax=Leptospira kmetyi TaxID=408139 RepID=A0A5F1XJ69_9LEPT|nr:DUF1566 domain-containing protein [Leptospira kmetyi]AYV54587.1 DUF1566 domain-containing protein [Leptospira kmetyi]EQA53578.1 PF07603 family protein [Leptospira kmetyi serovar Malaysia str. Bejo-Iso9]TGK12783.1 DUF1566 domain-containing protein [Leptospira kmetyi]TGK29249.1 DUF1566 domain-containing protein [Leptospira kmetyi]TGL71939.1 DUF1566 domain-containing protein [Leptospira kmetyi]
MKSKILFFVYIGFLTGSAYAYTGPFTDSGNGTILDQKSGLVWQKCANGQGSAGDSYSDCTVGTAVNMDWTSALAYCNTLNLAGTGGWRLPSFKELISLIDYNRAVSPYINPTFFPNAGANYWTSTTHPSSTYKNQAYYVQFTGGTYDTGDKVTMSVRVRCVK